MSDCPSCALPASFSSARFAFVWPPTVHACRKLERHFHALGQPVEHLKPASCLRVAPTDPAGFLVDLLDLLSPREQADTKLLFARDAGPSLADFGDMMSLREAERRLRGQWLLEILEEGRYHSVAQPIVSANTHSTVGYEYLVRGVEASGAIVSPAALFGSAHDPRILFNLDRAARLSAVETSSHLPNDALIFVNFVPGSVYDPNVCLRTTVAAINRLGIAPERVIFELVESQRIDDLDHVAEIIGFYRRAGFRVALDDFGVGQNNLNTFVRLKPDFIKLDKELTWALAKGEAHTESVEEFVRVARQVGTEIIAEGIETRAMAEALDVLGVDYMQGFHFGHPAAPNTQPEIPRVLAPVGHGAADQHPPA